MLHATSSSGPPVRLVASEAAGPPLEAVVRGVKASERWATDWVWREYSPMVFSLLERTLGPSGEAEDVLQEVFLRVYARVHTLEQPLALRSFVYSVAVRILKWELRRRRVRRFLTLSSAGELPEVPSEGFSPEARDILQRFYALLERLNADERLLFGLRHLEKLTVKEVSEALEISPATVKRRLARVAAKVSSLVAADPALQSHLQRTGAAYVEPD